MNRRYTQQNVIHSLQLLGQHLKKHQEEAQIQLVGGAAWMLAHKIRKDVGDVDALWDNWSDMVLRPWISKLATNNLFLQKEWLNNHAQDVVNVEKGVWTKYAIYGGLEVQVPDDKTTAAMMIAALKCVEPTNDKDQPFGRYAQDLVMFCRLKKWSAQKVLEQAREAYGTKMIPTICEEWVYRLVKKETSSLENSIESSNAVV